MELWSNCLHNLSIQLGKQNKRSHSTKIGHRLYVSTLSVECLHFATKFT